VEETVVVAVLLLTKQTLVTLPLVPVVLVR
jgi:hypothetical protein